MTVNCPHCKTKIKLDDNQAEGIQTCPSCNNLFHPPAKNKTCPNCNADMEAKSVICIKCGYNFDSGTFHETKHMEADEEEYALWQKALMLFFEIFPGLLRPLLIILFIACSALSIFLAYFSIILFGFGVFVSGFAVACGALVVYAQGISFLLSGEFLVINQAFIDFKEKHWWAFFIMIFLPFCGIFIFLSLLFR